MWRVRDVVGRPHTLDFTSSGQGRHRDTQVFLDGELFANAPSLSTWTEDRVQVVVCESCGMEHCEPGGWLALRSAGDLRVFLPMRDDRETDEDRAEYSPPEVVARRGAPLLEPAVYRQLQHLIPELPDLPRPISGAEARGLLTWEAPPAVVFDRTPQDFARSFVAAADQPVEDAIAAVLGVLGELRESAGPCTARPLAATDRPVTLYLNDDQFTEWTPIALSGTGAVVLWGQWVLEHSRAVA